MARVLQTAQQAECDNLKGITDLKCGGDIDERHADLDDTLNIAGILVKERGDQGCRNRDEDQHRRRNGPGHKG